MSPSFLREFYTLYNGTKHNRAARSFLGYMRVFCWPHTYTPSSCLREKYIHHNGEIDGVRLVTLKWRRVGSIPTIHFSFSFCAKNTRLIMEKLMVYG